MDPLAPLHSARIALADLSKLLFPPRCLACGVEGATELCVACAASLVAIAARGCRRCGGEPAREQRPRPRRCRRCLKRTFAFRRAIAALRYSGAVKELVRALKYRGRRAAAGVLARALVEAVRADPVARRVDSIVALPLHPLRRMGRGYDQAELLARAVATALRLPLLRGALLRWRFTVPQSLQRGERRAVNVRGAFCRGPFVRRVRGKRVLLVDDVMSTGATADAAARALLAAGARAVYVAVAAT